MNSSAQVVKFCRIQIILSEREMSKAGVWTDSYLMKLKQRKTMENLISWGHQDKSRFSKAKGCEPLWGRGASLNRNGPTKRPEENGSHRVTYVNKRVPPYALKETSSLNSSVQPMRKDVMLAQEWHANISPGVWYNHKSVWAERTRKKYLRMLPQCNPASVWLTGDQR